MECSVRRRKGAVAGVWAAGTAVLVLGVLLGEAVDALVGTNRVAQQADAGRRRPVPAALHHREAAAINDSLVQSVAMAKWALEAGKVALALDILQESIECGQRRVTALMNASDDHALESKVDR
jgi:hypothetical protein